MPSTLTKTATAAITYTQLAVATLAAIMAGGSALAATALTNHCNTIRVNSCRKANGGIYVRLNSKSKVVFVPSGCRATRNGARNYTFSCASAKSYKTCWKTCSLSKSSSSASTLSSPQSSGADGVCADGDAQIQPQYAGKNIFVASKITLTNITTGKVIQTSADYCLPGMTGPGSNPNAGSNTVSEYYCDGASLQSVNINCPLGYLCTNGACQKANLSCSDSDGLNYYIRGTVNQSNGQSGSPVNSYTDQCLDGNILNEGYCYGNEILQYPVNCGTVVTNGVCRDGLCLTGGNTGSASTLSLVPSCQMNFGCSAGGSRSFVSTSVDLGEFYVKNSAAGEAVVLKSVKLKLTGDFILAGKGDNSVAVKLIGDDKMILGQGAINSVDNGQSAEATINLGTGVSFTNQLFFYLAADLTDSDFGFPANSSSSRYLQATVIGFNYQKDTMTGSGTANVSDDRRNFIPVVDNPPTASVKSYPGSNGSSFWLSADATDDVKLVKVELYKGINNSYNLPLVRTCDNLSNYGVSCAMNFNSLNDHDGYYYDKAYDSKGQVSTSEIKAYHY